MKFTWGISKIDWFNAISNIKEDSMNSVFEIKKNMNLKGINKIIQSVCPQVSDPPVKL